MTERDLQSRFTQWTRTNPPPVTTVWELKMSKGTSIPFEAVKDHQMLGLMYASTKQGLFHKIQDFPMRAAANAGLMRFGKPKPFDCLYLVNTEAYIVVCFYKLRQKKECMFIDPMVWQTERSNSTRKSLTEARAREISSKIEII